MNLVKNRCKTVSILLFAVIILQSFFGCTQDGKKLTVDILDIGKADCILLQYEGSVVLIDTGEDENLPEIKRHLFQQNISRIDYLIISHFDKDHIGGGAGIVEEYDVKNVFLSSFEKDSVHTRSLMTALDNKGITPVRLTENADLHIKDLSLTISPPKKRSYAVKEDNNASLVVTAQLGEKRLLFCGDAMEARIDELLNESIDNIDFLKVPYHGRMLENLNALLDKTAPSVCAITCSKKNPPDENTISLLAQRNIKTYLTENGTVRVIVSPDSISTVQL